MSMSCLAIARSVYSENLGNVSTTLDYIWVTVSIITTLYAFFWDTVMDWYTGRCTHADCTAVHVYILCACRGLGQCIWDGRFKSTSEDETDKSYPLLLRDNLYFSPTVYYASTILNFLMRLGWAFLISPEQPYVKQNYILLLGSVELFRRSLWAVFR